VDFNDLLSTSLAPEWGGHVLISPGGPLPFAGMAVIDLIHYGPADSTFIQNHRRLPKQAQWFVFNKELRQFYGLREGCRHRV